MDQVTGLDIKKVRRNEGRALGDVRRNEGSGNWGNVGLGSEGRGMRVNYGKRGK